MTVTMIMTATVRMMMTIVRFARRVLLVGWQEGHGADDKPTPNPWQASTSWTHSELEKYNLEQRRNTISWSKKIPTSTLHRSIQPCKHLHFCSSSYIITADKRSERIREEYNDRLCSYGAERDECLEELIKTWWRVSIGDTPLPDYSMETHPLHLITLRPCEEVLNSGFGPDQYQRTELGLKKSWFSIQILKIVI